MRASASVGGICRSMCDWRLTVLYYLVIRIPTTSSSLEHTAREANPSVPVDLFRDFL